MAVVQDRLVCWLHRKGIARALSSRSGNFYEGVDYLMESRRWTPRWLIVWAAKQDFQWMYSSRAARLRLATVQRHSVADGSRRWSLHFKLPQM